ncbi:hypothetical protein [Stutzerimonas stutzeri]|uniref:hypothetical protein n=1 Tax=Stutzerimonas stutzeri TaxID=316 RepID=UPI0015E30042|nr:hypothetical protein [Stutzerimonas stutzeri]MBA1280313.1 hypothetical protein [Stutzerimonas stutzeri]
MFQVDLFSPSASNVVLAEAVPLPSGVLSRNVLRRLYVAPGSNLKYPLTHLDHVELQYGLFKGRYHYSVCVNVSKACRSYAPSPKWRKHAESFEAAEVLAIADAVALINELGKGKLNAGVLIGMLARGDFEESVREGPCRSMFDEASAND